MSLKPLIAGMANVPGPNVTNASGTLPVANGGTGAGTALAARDSLALNRFFTALATDQTVTSSTTFVTATGLTFTLPAGAWLIHWFAVFGNASATPDAKVQLDYGGVSCSQSSVGMFGSTGAAASANFPWPSSATTSQTFSGVGQFGGVFMTTQLTNSVPITLALQFAQNASSVDATTLKAKSYLIAIQVA